MQLLFFHGEAILFGFLIQCFLALLGGGAWLYGIVKYPSLPAALTAIGYFTATFTCAVLSQGAGGPALGTVVLALTLPWNLIMPCFDPYLGPCRISLGGAVICAVLNAAVLYFIVGWKRRLQ